MNPGTPNPETPEPAGASAVVRRHSEDALKKIEWMLSETSTPVDAGLTGNHDQGYGDLTDLNRDGLILQSIGRERLESFANDYLELLGTSSAIYETNGDYAFGIFTSGWCRMMDSASRKLCETPDNVEALHSGRWLCHESCWTDCCKRVVAESAPVDIACNGGIRMYAVPILANGKVAGAINFGYGDPPSDPEQLRTLAKAYRIGLDDLVGVAEAYDSRPPFLIELAKKRLHATALLIGSMLETKQAEDALRKSEEMMRNSQSLAHICSYSTNLNIHQLEESCWVCSPEFYEIFGIDRNYPHTIGGWAGFIHPDFREEMIAYHEAVIREKGFFNREYKIIRINDGAERWVHGTGELEFDPTGNPVRMHGAIQDITERKRIEQDLKESEERFRALHNASFGGITIHDKGVILECNQGLSEITGYGYDELIGMDGLSLISDATRDLVVRNISAGYEKPYEAEGVRKNGETYPLRLEARNIRYKGKDVRVVEFRDISENKQAEKEKEHLEAQLWQAQKMESVGRLAGGVAHDFNNMIMGVMGYADLCRKTIADDHPIQDWLAEILRESRRSADLTRQLLAFARQQTIAPQLLDLNDAVGNMLKMLRRLIGEDIDLVWQPGASPWTVKVDPGQVDQILANLCVNARDAIGGSAGKVAIETENVTIDAAYCADHLEACPGDYVMLVVSDNGCGMDRKMVENIFEPFFTTKDVGEGTGLGLATVYGIVKQNQGFINVYSEPGKGTTFRIYLPRVVETATPHAADNQENPPAGGTETIMLVEDEKSIRFTLGLFLTDLGYTVLSADSPAVALRLACEHGTGIDLLVTDVVMPGMSGRELAEKLAPDYPTMQVLFMSGYTADVIAHRGILEEGVHFVSKPVARDTLARMVRGILDQGK